MRYPRLNDHRVDDHGERCKVHEPYPAAVHAALPEGG
jgi:hypothetical protein